MSLFEIDQNTLYFFGIAFQQVSTGLLESISKPCQFLAAGWMFLGGGIDGMEGRKG